MSSPELVPVQHPSRLRVIGAPEPETSVHYFTAGTSLDDDLLKRLRGKSDTLPQPGLNPRRVIGLPAPSREEILESRASVRSWASTRCKAARDLFEGTPDAGSVILTCEKEHHMDVHAHRMTNPDGSVTTWRN